MPDRDRVPGRNAALWAGWVGYNHTIGLAGPTLAVLAITVLSITMWILWHPARIALAGFLGFAFFAPRTLLAVLVTIGLLAATVAMFRSSGSTRPAGGQPGTGEVDVQPVVVPMRTGRRPARTPPAMPTTPGGSPNGPQAA